MTNRTTNNAELSPRVRPFRRNEGQYRETDHVTRLKLVKSGKHWLRAATSHFGLFKIISGRVDASSVSVHQVEEEVPLVTSDRL